MVLTQTGIDNKTEWVEKCYRLPEYHRREMIEKTLQAPEWIHFGGGNLFRGFQAYIAQRLLNEGLISTGIVVVEGFDTEVVEKVYHPHDDLSILVTLKSSGATERTVIGSVAKAIMLNKEYKEDEKLIKEMFRNPSLKMVSFTITEKGYCLADEKEQLFPAVEKDFSRGPKEAESYMGKVAALMYERYLAGEYPVALVSMDNCSRNGDRLHGAMIAYAQKWCEHGFVEEGFVKYLGDTSKVSYPWTMIDKITPRPDEQIEELLMKDGITGISSIVTKRGTHTAPYVNAEESEYLVIEDDFPNGRLPLEKAGIIFTTKETVGRVEQMKVGTCLNPLHTALSVFGCLLGFHTIAEEMKDSDLRKMVEILGYKEGLPVAVHPGVIHPEQFLNVVITKRFTNPFLPDSPWRIVTDTSQKLPIRFGMTINNYIDTGKNTEKLSMIPLVFAGWLRYLVAVDDKGTSFEPSPDPLLAVLKKQMEPFYIGYDKEVEPHLKELLQNESIFGVNLYEANLAKKVCSYFSSMIAKEGAVRETLHQAVTEKGGK